MKPSHKKDKNESDQASISNCQFVEIQKTEEYVKLHCWECNQQKLGYEKFYTINILILQ